MNSTFGFESDSIWHLIFKNGFPSMLTMVVVIIYNLADTFFVGQTHNDMMVAAVSVAAPIFTLLITIGIALMKVGGWLSADEALAWGFVDELTEFDDETAPVLLKRIITS